MSKGKGPEKGSTNEPNSSWFDSTASELPSYSVSDPSETPTNSVPPPDDLSLEASQNLIWQTTTTGDDGRIDINLDSRLAKTIARFIKYSQAPEPLPSDAPPEYPFHEVWPLPMNIVLQVVGSRGDVQPFIALGNELQRFGHRVRLATHDVFKNFVLEAGLEFFPIGGDPAELMAYMVKNPGLIPSMKTFRDGEITRKRAMIREMLDGCWRSCIAQDPETHRSFVANAIIANPPSFAHIHCAQALGIPLHLMFTMPWTMTRAFPHPLANIRNTTTNPSMANFLSYGLVQCLTWQGIGDIINDWRVTLDLEPVPSTEGPFLAETLQVPYSYCWSPGLVPKPKDWGTNIDVCGFIFREPPEFNPPSEIENFLKSGPPPIYIGFGSIVIDHPKEMTDLLVKAVRACGTRAIISRGWSKLGYADQIEGILFIDDCPHEWLFQHVTAVVHHGGAGTTSCGLLNGRPTTIIPFFGDQPFWGSMVATAGAGPPPIPHKHLRVENLSAAIRFCLGKEAYDGAMSISEKMKSESGARDAVASFHRHLPLNELSCDVNPKLPAVWIKRSKPKMKLSGFVAEMLLKQNKIKVRDLQLYEPKRIHIENRRWDPITAGSSSLLFEMTYNLFDATQSMWMAPHRIREDAARSGELTQNPGKTTAAMIGASAMSIPRIYGAVLKGTIVDMPLALTEGLRATPKLYGEHVPDHEPIVDWKSGAVVAGKTFAVNFRDGLSDLVVQPHRGYHEEGSLGLTKGIGRGLIGTVTKTSSACIGLVAYPAQGIYKSLYNVTHQSTKRMIAHARRVEALIPLQRGVDPAEVKAALHAFEDLEKDKSSD